jgi:sigma-E factor negative regulatory protein RseA
MNEELDSQLSAMFDDELAAAECELLARRLSRDEQLKARWGRYAVIGAAIRSERGVRLNAPLAGRVSALILAEPALAGSATPHGARQRGLRWWQPVAGVAVAAGVAAVSILWLRTETPLAVTAQNIPPAANPAPAVAVNPLTPGGPNSYVVPQAPAVRAVVVPSTELANYVVAHSMFSAPVARRNLLSAFMTGESDASNEPAVTTARPPGDVQVNVR